MLRLVDRLAAEPSTRSSAAKAITSQSLWSVTIAIAQLRPAIRYVRWRLVSERRLMPWWAELDTKKTFATRVARSDSS